jgi:hypothetical protein
MPISGTGGHGDYFPKDRHTNKEKEVFLFLKKEIENFCCLRHTAGFLLRIATTNVVRQLYIAKVFWFFFFKKELLPQPATAKSNLSRAKFGLKYGSSAM